MKKQFLLIVLFSFVTLFLHAQSIPTGMNYQAVARDKSGEILANKTLTLKVSLVSQLPTQNYFTEIHRITTNQFGLFTLVVGKGSVVSGDFNQIPWSSKEIWMEVGVKNDGETDFTLISSSKLLTVPYAFHAGTADGLSGDYHPYPGLSNSGTGNGSSTLSTGSTGNSWQMAGNTGSHPPTDYVGSSDTSAFVFKTKATERMRINGVGVGSAVGDVTINNSLNVEKNGDVANNLHVKFDATIDRHDSIGNDLTVKAKTEFNKSQSPLDSTINNGAFTVGNIRPSVLTGRLTVDSMTNLNSSLNVNNIKPTLFTGTLKVNNATDLFGPFKVNNGNPSVLTGTLRVDSDAVFKQHMLLDNFGINFNSLNSSTGALVVAGGVGIQKNFNVAGKSRFGGTVNFTKQVKMTATNVAYDVYTGTLVVVGGAGIHGKLYEGGSAHFGDSLVVQGPTALRNTLDVTGASNLNNTLDVTDSSTLRSTLNVGDNTTLDTNLNALKHVSLYGQNLASSSQSDYSAYALRVEGSEQGIVIKAMNEANPNHETKFVSFFSGNTPATQKMTGRIEGMTGVELASNRKYQIRTATFNDLYDSEDIAIGMAGFLVLKGLKDAWSAFASVTACAGLGQCVTDPSISFIAYGAFESIGAAVIEGQTIGTKITNENDRDLWQAYKLSHAGVTYESGSGDYAEYLQRADLSEKINFGDIVSVTGGKITKNTSNADKVMIVSFKPIVLGNVPEAGKIKEYEKVAFLGQVPVRVTGVVHVGDYILPSGDNDGIGIAVDPSHIRLADVRKIAGVAWSASKSNSGIEIINVAVGLNRNDNLGWVKKYESKINAQTAEIDALKRQMAETNQRLVQLVPGFAPVASLNSTQQQARSSAASAVQHASDFEIDKNGNAIVYAKPMKEDILEGMKLAEKTLSGEPNHEMFDAFFKRVEADPSYKEKLVNSLLTKVTATMEQSKTLNRRK